MHRIEGRRGEVVTGYGGPPYDFVHAFYYELRDVIAEGILGGGIFTFQRAAPPCLSGRLLTLTKPAGRGRKFKMDFDGLQFQWRSPVNDIQNTEEIHTIRILRELRLFINYANPAIPSLPKILSKIFHVEKCPGSPLVGKQIFPVIPPLDLPANRSLELHSRFSVPLCEFVWKPSRSATIKYRPYPFPRFLMPMITIGLADTFI